MRGKARIGLRVGAVLGRYKMRKHFNLTIDDTGFSFTRDEANLHGQDGAGNGQPELWLLQPRRVSGSCRRITIVPNVVGSAKISAALRRFAPDAFPGSIVVILGVRKPPFSQGLSLRVPYRVAEGGLEDGDTTRFVAPD